MMNKLVLACSLLFVGTMSFAQKLKLNEKANFLSKSCEQIKHNKGKSVLKAGGDVVFEETFPSIGTWTTSGVDGAFWLHDTDGPDGQYSATDNSDIIESTTVADGFMIFDADLSNPAQPFSNRVGSLVSPVIDLSATPNVNLIFEHNYRTCCSRSFYPKVEVSTDDFVTSTEYDVTVYGVEVNDLSGTTTTVINLSDYTATAGNLANFKLRFTFDGGVGQSHYFWQIDDVKLIEQFDINYALNRAWLGDIVNDFEVTETPTALAGNLIVQAALENLGFQNPTNARLQVRILDDAMNEVATETGGTLSNNFALNYDTITFNTSIDLSALPVASYSVEMTFLMDETDQDMTNNTLTRTLRISADRLSSINFDEFVYRENIGYDYRDATTNFTTSMEVGTIFSIPSDINLYGLDIALSTSTNFPTSIDEEINLRIYEYLPDEENSFVQVYGDYGYLVESGMFSASVNYYTFNFYNSNNTSGLPVQLLAGKRYVATFSHFGGPQKYLWYWTGRNDDDYSSFVYGPFGQNSAINWFRAGYDPLIKMNFDQTLTVKQIYKDVLNLSIVPNPFTEEANLLYTMLNEDKITIEVSDIQGKVISNSLIQAKKGHNEYSLSNLNLAKGFYQAKVKSANGTQQVKFIVK